MTASGKYRVRVSRQTVIDCLAGFFVAALTLVVFLPSLRNGFIGWDDNAVFYNPNIRVIDLSFLKWVFTTPISYNWHPLTFISFALDYRFSGSNPAGYHLTNIVIHSLNTLLVFILALTLIRLSGESRIKFKEVCLSMALPAAFIAAFIFGLHPLRVESVVWISERKDVLCTFFFLLSLVFHISYISKGSARGYVLALVFFIFALLSKPMAVSLPFVLLILDYYLIDGFWRRGTFRKIILGKIPFFLLSLLSIPLTIWAQSKLIQSLDKMPFVYRPAIAAHGYIFYLYKLLLPINLVPFYPIPKHINFFSIEYAGAALLFIFLTVLFLWVLRGRRALQAIWLYYIITLIPVIGIVQVGVQAAADRYTYIPTIGFIIIASTGAVYAFKASNAHGRVVLATAGLFLAITLVTLTHRQIGVWKNDETLLTYQIDTNPTYLAFYNRAIVYSNRGNLPRAIDDYTVTIRLYPQFRNAYLSRAKVYTILGDYPLAINDYNKLIELYPSEPAAYYDLGLLYSRTGRDDLAAYFMQRSAEMGFKP